MERESDIYEAELAKLEYVYPSSIVNTMVVPKGLKPFNIEYDNPALIGHRTPLDAYVDSFGPQEAGRPCSKCRAHCQGHYGIVKFPKVLGRDSKEDRLMLYHYQFRDTVLNIFKVVCGSCSSLTVDKNDPAVRKQLAEILSLPRHKRLKKLVLYAGKSGSGFTECPCVHENKDGTKLTCPVRQKRVGGPKGGVLVDTKPAALAKGGKGTTATGVSTKVVRTPCRPRDDYNALMLMSAEDKELIGVSDDDIRGMFVKSILVMPTMFRPRTGKNRVNKFTSCITSIIQACINLHNDKNREAEVASSLNEQLKKYIEGWIALFNGKKGLFKGSVHGKLGGTSARGVAVPDSSVRHGQVSVSYHYAETSLCVEVAVTQCNLLACQALVNNRRVYEIKKGRGPTAGVKTRVSADNFADRSNHTLEVGDTIWRHARTGDPVVVARQPIQNLQNIVGMELVVRPRINGYHEEDYSIGVPLTLCPGFGLDFDGDTLMIFIAQTPEAQEDIRRKMFLTRNIRSAQRAEPIHGLYYHDILASSLITLPNVDVDMVMWSICVSDIDIDKRVAAVKRIKAEGVDVYSARGLLSVAFPPDFYFNDGKVLIENGVYKKGFLTSSVTTHKSGGIVDKMSIFYSGCGSTNCACKEGGCEMNGWKITADFINDAIKILTRFLDGFGFTISHKDTVIGDLNEEATKQYYKVFEEIMMLPTPKGYYQTLKYDKDVAGIVNSVRSVPTNLGMLKPQEYQVGMSDDEAVGNKILFMSKTVSGTKGDANNLTSIAFMLGQQRLLGKTLAKVLTNGSRMLVTNRPGSLNPAHRGFIAGSYAKGLTPEEVFYAAHSNMEGQASTQNITPTIGFMQKSLSKLLENTISRSGGMIYNNRTVVNFAAGGDAMNPSDVLVIQGSIQSVDIDTILGAINTSRDN